MELEVPDCADVNLLEHVIAKVHVSAGKKRGDLKIILTSASHKKKYIDGRL